MNRDKQNELIADVYRAKLVYQAEMKSPEYRAKGEEDFEFIGKALAAKGYCKASEVALKTAYDFQNRLRHIFLNMCVFNDYNTLNLLQIDNAIEALYDTFIAELKKKYTGGQNEPSL